MNELMLRVNNVSKQYVLGQIGGTTLRDELQRWSARLHGREDPTKKIGTRDYNVGETFLALDGVSFDVKSGERIGIIGHNGAGKSTLLKLISRVTAPTSGRIGLNGRVASMLEVGTGFHGELTGRENIYMNGAILGMNKKEIDAKIDDIIEFSECRQFIDTPVKRYSSGMYVKLAFAVAAHLDSEIMIMDEVLAVGDVAFQKKCLEKMSDVSKTEGRTILYVSHNMNTIRQLCDRVIVLDHGKIVFDGDVEEGIELYLRGNDKNTHNNIILTDNQRTPQFYGSDIKIERVIVALENNYINFGDNLELQVRFQNVSDMDKNVYMRVIIKTNNGIGVTMSFTQNEILLPAKTETDKKFLLKTNELVPGKYILDFVLCELGRFGAEEKKDVIENLYHFNVMSTDTFNHGRSWDNNYWGNISIGCMEEINP